MDETLSLTADRTLIRAGGASTRYLLADVDVPLRAGDHPRLPINVALVIDRSGSMRGAKIGYACDAARYALGLLTAADRVAVVAFDDRIEVPVPSTRRNPPALAAAREAIAHLDARGTTDLAAGWLTGCREIATHLEAGTIARCLVLTDGLANRGTTDPDVLVRHATELRARGIVTSTFGIGNDFDEVLLGALAEAGGGMFRFIRDAEAIPALLRDELQESLDVAMPRARLVVRAPRGTTVTSLNGFPVTTAGDGSRHVALGDLVAGQVLNPVLGIEFPPGAAHAGVTVEITLRSDADDAGGCGSAGGNEADVARASVAFEYAGHAANDAQPRNRRVDREVATLFAAHARREALGLNRRGDFAGAERAAARCANRIGQYAGDDAELNRIVEDLRREAARLAVDMEIHVRKSAFYATTSKLRMRSSRGASMRRSAAPSVVVVPCSDVSVQAAEAAVDAFQRAGVRSLGRVRVTQNWASLRAAHRDAPLLEPARENALVDAAHARWPEEGLRVVLTPARLADNGYSHWHAAGRTAVVSLHRVADLLGVELAAYLAYETLLNGLNNASPRYDLLQLAHDETRGCLFDLCSDKCDMEIKLQNMHLCASCAESLGYLGLDLEDLARATDVVRDLARPVAA